jgi:hypothetical protein
MRWGICAKRDELTTQRCRRRLAGGQRKLFLPVSCVPPITNQRRPTRSAGPLLHPPPCSGDPAKQPVRYAVHGSAAGCVAGACHAATASSVNHTVRLPRRTSAASYSGQFATGYLAFRILWRRLSLNLYGMGSTARRASDDIVYLTARPPTLLSVRSSNSTLPIAWRARTHTPYKLGSIHAPRE